MAHILAKAATQGWQGKKAPSSRDAHQPPPTRRNMSTSACTAHSAFKCPAFRDTRSRSPVVYACRQQQLKLDWSSICRLERCEHMPLRRRLADLCLTSKAYSKAGGSLLRSTSGASADGRQIGLMIGRLNMLGATPESPSKAAKPTDDPHGRFTFGTSLDSYGTRPAGFGRVNLRMTSATSTQASSAHGAPPAADRSYSAVAMASTTSSQHQPRCSSTLHPPPASQHEARPSMQWSDVSRWLPSKTRNAKQLHNSCTTASCNPSPLTLIESNGNQTRSLSLRRSGLDESTKRPSPKLMYRCNLSHSFARAPPMLPSLQLLLLTSKRNVSPTHVTISPPMRSYSSSRPTYPKASRPP
jgi:hypothetical protein